MTTLKDLSRHLNISVTQVSRALNDHDDVSPATRQRVKKAAKELGYEPNISARRLVTGRSDIFALVVDNMPNASSESQFVQEISGLSRQFAKRGKQFLLHIHDGESDVIPVYRKLIASGAIDGFVLTETWNMDRRIEFLSEKSAPFAVHGRDRDNPDYPYYDIDNVGVGEVLTNHLISNGHERIAFIHGPEARSFTHYRQIGHLKALESAGIMPNSAYFAFGAMTEGLGLTETIRFMGLERPPTAIIASNMAVAAGVYRALEALHLRVPQDVSVVAHDDMMPNQSASHFVPPITATEAPISNSWAPLTDILLESIDKTNSVETQQVRRFVFKERSSVAHPR